VINLSEIGLTKLYNPNEGQMRVVGFMSSSGSNLVKILEAERKLEKERGVSPYKMVGIFSDRWKSRAPEIGSRFGIPVIFHGIGGFYAKSKKPFGDMEVRAEYDQITSNLLVPLHAQVIAAGGYMAAMTEVLFNEYLSVNVHPADLSILNDAGERKYRGDDAVRDAILAGEKYLRSSMHIIEEEVDGGRLLMASRPVEVELPELWNPEDRESVANVSDANQERLKVAGDWVIFPRTLLHLAEGRYAQDDDGNLYFDGMHIPNGLRLED